MDNHLSKTFTLLGCTPSEIRFLLALYHLGPATIPLIAHRTRIRRSSAYLIFQSLLQKSLLVEDQKGYAKKIYPLEPAKLVSLLASRQRQFRHQELELESKLPDLQSFFNTSQIQPKVRVFQGNSGLIQVWRDILSAPGEILLWTNQQTENRFFMGGNHDKFIAQRLAKKIPIRVLAVPSPESDLLVAADSQSLRHTKILPPQVTFSAETYLYANKVAILDYDKDIIGVIIESQPIFTAQKAIFELTWTTHSQYAPLD